MAVLSPRGFDQLPPQLECKDLESLLAGHRAGDPDAREALILGHMRLAVSIAQRFKSPRHTSLELQTEAVSTLVRLVDQAPEGNFGAYIAVSIRRSLQQYIVNDTSVRIPPSTVRRNGMVQYCQVSLPKTKARESRIQLEVRELVEMAITTPVQREVIDLRLQNMTYKEIADETGLGQSTIRTCWDKFVKRFHYLWSL